MAQTYSAHVQQTYRSSLSRCMYLLSVSLLEIEVILH